MLSGNNKDEANCVSEQRMAQNIYAKALVLSNNVPLEELLVLLMKQWSDHCDLNSPIKFNIKIGLGQNCDVYFIGFWETRSL